MINIATIEYYLDDDKIVNTDIDGEETLLDADLVIVDPSDFNRLWKNDITKRNDSTVTVYSPMSDKVRRIFESRRKEIDTLLENGKIIVCFVCPLNGFNGEIDDKSNYSPITNYDFLPMRQAYWIENLKAGKGATNTIKLNNSNLFAPYYKAFKNELEYSAYLDINTDDKNINFLVNRSGKPVGFQFQVRNGLVAFLPPVNYIQDNKKLISTLVNSTKDYLNKKVITPPPNWIENIKLKGEQKLNVEIDKFNLQINKLVEKKERVAEKKEELTRFKTLLYEQGHELEDAVIDAFKLMGFSAENRQLDDLEHDIIFESKEGKGLAELEGKDNDAIHISKLDQLNRAVDEDFELTGKYPQGLLIGNHYRFTKPQERKDPFTEKVQIVAKKKSFGLLTTTEIFKAIELILENPNDESLKENLRIKILKTEGEIIKLK